MNTTLDDFQLADSPTKIDDIDKTAPEPVVKKFDELDPYETVVTINGQRGPLIVGKNIELNPKIYRLYHPPRRSQGQGFAGKLVLEHTYNSREPNEYYAGYDLAGDSSDEETKVVPVTELKLRDDTRSERLNNALDEMRTLLTGEDWTETGRADTSYGQWLKAVSELTDFADDLEPYPEQFDKSLFSKPKVMHAIARYPHDADTILRSAARAIDEHAEDGFYSATPTGLRSLLRRYADAHLGSS